MKQTPVLFSTQMVQGILEKRKTKTRRTKGLELVNKRANDWCAPSQQPCTSDNKFVFTAERGEAQQLRIKCPYGNVGDVLWVRETFEKCKIGYRYKANNISAIAVTKWKPSIHMPKEACRIWLQITNIKIERLQDIIEQDAIDEGVKFEWYDKSRNIKIESAKSVFKNLWLSINGDKSWNTNPFVWVIEFTQIQKEIIFTINK